MWIMTRYGFISVVAHDAPGYDLQVRARDRQTLEQIRDRYQPEAQILALPGRDYQFRFYTSRDVFADVLAAMGREITYPNFKNTVRGGLHDLCNELWWVIFNHYRHRDGAPADDLVYGDPCPACGKDGWPAGSAGNARRCHELDEHEGDPRIEPRWRPTAR